MTRLPIIFYVQCVLFTFYCTPRQSRGYLGFSMVTLPPQTFLWNARTKNISFRPFKFGVWVDMEVTLSLLFCGLMKGKWKPLKGQNIAFWHILAQFSNTEGWMITNIIYKMHIYMSSISMQTLAFSLFFSRSGLALKEKARWPFWHKHHFVL